MPTTTALDTQVMQDPTTGKNGGLDFENEQSNEEDFFDPLEYPVQKRSLSNGDSFFPKQDEEALEGVPEKLAATASDPDSSGPQSSSAKSNPANIPSDETKSNTEESKSSEAIAKKRSSDGGENNQM